MRILIVEDDFLLANRLVEALTAGRSRNSRRGCIGGQSDPAAGQLRV